MKKIEDVLTGEDNNNNEGTEKPFSFSEEIFQSMKNSPHNVSFWPRKVKNIEENVIESVIALRDEERKLV